MVDGDMESDGVSVEDEEMLVVHGVDGDEDYFLGSVWMNALC